MFVILQIQISSDKQCIGIAFCGFNKAGDTGNLINFNQFFAGYAHNVHRHFTGSEFHSQFSPAAVSRAET